MKQVDNYRLVELLSLVSRRFHRYMMPIVGAEGLSYSEMVVLWKMHRKKRCRATDLADDIGIPPSTLTGVIDRLVTKGCLNRFPDPEDRRAVLLEAGKPAFDLLDRMKQAGKERLAEVFRAIPPDRMEGLIAGLEEILEHLERDDGAS